MTWRFPGPQLGAVALAIVLNACTAPNQQAANPTPGTGVVNVPTSPTPPMPGGYMNQAVDTQAMQDEAQAAIALLRERTKDPSITLAALRTARSQVVAGANFELTMDITTKDGPKSVTVVMYRNLQGERSLTSVTGL
jgi:hypothetical protein